MLLIETRLKHLIFVDQAGLFKSNEPTEPDPRENQQRP
jgi:hypothetical protein